METSVMSWTTSSPVSSSVDWSSSESTSNEMDDGVVEQFQLNRRINDFAFFCLIAAYCTLIVCGILGNSLIVFVVARQPTMRTARNVFIVNLAISNLLFCFINMPFTLMEISYTSWQLGDSTISCKMVGSLQAVSIFVSTLSITAIALDPTKKNFPLSDTLLALVSIWIVGIVLALPLFIVRRLMHFPNSIDFCLEDWPSEKGRLAYSIGSMLVQYALPIVTLSVVHACIANKLRFRTSTQQHPPRPATSYPVATNGLVIQETEGRKAVIYEEQLRQTNKLLFNLVIIFAISWLPMNMFNVVVDTWNVFGDNTEAMVIVYAVCHMAGMSSACANPLLIGWLNDNFRKEFHKIGASLMGKTRCSSEPTGLSANKRSNRVNTTAEGDMTINQGSVNANRPAASATTTI